MKSHIQKKFKFRIKSFLLLEIILSLFLITLCFFPLLKTHFAIRSAEQKELLYLTLAREADLAFISLKEKIYRQSHSWEELVHGGSFTFLESELEKMPSYPLHYTLRPFKHSTKHSGTTYVLIQVIFSFALESSKQANPQFRYAVLVEGRQV